jgi:hypothetical protein
MADAKDILQVLVVITAAFPNFHPKDETPEVYLQLLADIPADELKIAVVQCCTESGRAFAPSIGEIRGAVAELRRVTAGVPTKYEAWQEVTASFEHPERPWSHPLVKEAVDQIGWWDMGHSENQAAERARFLDAYDRLLKREERRQTMLPAVREYIAEHTPLMLDTGSEARLPARSDDAPAPDYSPAPAGVSEQIKSVLARTRRVR